VVFGDRRGEERGWTRFAILNWRGRARRRFDHEEEEVDVPYSAGKTAGHHEEPSAEAVMKAELIAAVVRKMERRRPHTH
jgi:hypothetical protein